MLKCYSGKDWILANLKNEKVRFLDVRTNGEYTGKISYGSRGGHIPGAVNLHLQKLLDGGMILQRHERGDYMITDKGYRILNGIADMCRNLT